MNWFEELFSNPKTAAMAQQLLQQKASAEMPAGGDASAGGAPVQTQQAQTAEPSTGDGLLSTVNSFLSKPSVAKYLLNMGAGLMETSANGAGIGYGLGKGMQLGNQGLVADLDAERAAAAEAEKFKLQQNDQYNRAIKLEDYKANKATASQTAEALGWKAMMDKIDVTPEMASKYPGLTVLKSIDPNTAPVAFSEAAKDLQKEMNKQHLPDLISHDGLLVDRHTGQPVGGTSTSQPPASNPTPPAKPGDTSQPPAGSNSWKVEGAPANPSTPAVAPASSAPVRGTNEPISSYNARMEAWKLEKQQSHADALESKKEQFEKEQDIAKQKLGFSAEQQKLDGPIVAKNAEGLQSQINGINTLTDMERLARKSNTGAVAGSEVGQAVRNLIGDEEFQTLQGLQGQAAIDYLGGKLGAGISNADVDVIFKTIMDPKKESTVNVTTIRSLITKMKANVKATKKQIEDYQNNYKVKVLGYEPSVTDSYVNYPKQVKIKGVVKDVEDYDPRNKSYLIDGVWVQ